MGRYDPNSQLNEGFNYEKIRQMARDRGYTTDRSIAQVNQKIFGISYNAAESKLHTGNYTFEESFVFAAYFGMTPKEYCDCFLWRIFRENREGHYIVMLDDPGRVLRRRAEQRKRKEEKAEARKREREEIAKALEEEYGSLSNMGI